MEYDQGALEGRVLVPLNLEFWIELPEPMTPEEEWRETVEAFLEGTR